MLDRMMDANEVQKLISGKGSALCAILFANSRPRIAGYLALARAIKDAGHLCFLLHPYKSAPDGEEIAGYEDLHIGCLRAEDLRSMRGVDVFFSSEVVSDVAPDDSVTVGIFHSLPELLKANYADAIDSQPSIIRSLDYLVVAMRQRKTNWEIKNYERFVQGVYPPELLRHRKATLDIVPGGYPKLDYLQKLVSGNDGLDTILYGPTRSILKQGQMREKGATIIGSLLAKFPHHRIVFRPYPIEDDLKAGRELASAFASNQRFIFDDTVTGIKYVQKCAVMVTDRSSVAVSFALATGRPIVLTDLSEGADELHPIKREIYGFITKGRDAMLDAVANCIENQRGWKESIFEKREQLMYNPGTASAYLASKLPVFAKRGSDQGWLKVPRTPWLRAGDNEERKRHLDLLLKRSQDGRRRAARQTYDEVRQFLEGVAIP